MRCVAHEISVFRVGTSVLWGGVVWGSWWGWLRAMGQT